jgi:transposase-like protein
MRQKTGPAKAPAEQVVKEIRRATRRQFSAEDKIRIVLEGLRGEHSIAELCRREGIAESLYYTWSKEFLEAGKRRLAGDTARVATSGEVKDLRREAQALKEVVAEQALELRLLKKKHDRGWGMRGMRYPASEKLEIIRLVEAAGGRAGGCTLVNSCDTDWYDWQPALEGADVFVDQLIPEWCHPKWLAKKAR